MDLLDAQTEWADRIMILEAIDSRLQTVYRQLAHARRVIAANGEMADVAQNALPRLEARKTALWERRWFLGGERG